MLAQRVADRIADLATAAGRVPVVVLALSMLLIGAASGLLFRFSAAWQLAIVTAAALVTCVMVFLIKHAQNRDGIATQAKLDDLVRASRADAFKLTPDYYYLNAHKSIDIATEIDVFSNLSRQIIAEGRTLLNYDRLYTLFQAVMQLPDNPIAVEVGAYKGGGSKFIAELLRSHKGGGRLYSCDTFAGHAAVDDRYDGMHAVINCFGDVSAEEVKRYLEPLGNTTVLVGDIATTYTGIKEQTVNLIHLDADVYLPIKFVLDTFWIRMAPRGFIIVDDYGFTSCKGAKQAVDEFMAQRKDCLQFHLLTGQCLLIKA